MLEAMERDDFDQLPAGVLGRGHLRAFAKEVELDPDRVVERFRAEWVTEPPPPIESSLPPAAILRQSMPIQALIIGAVLVAAFTLVIQVIMREAPAGEPDAVGTSGLAAADTAPAAVGPASGLAASRGDLSSSQQARAPQALSLELSPTGTVWVEARADGQRVLYSLMAKGDRPVVQAKEEIQLRLGNAGALDYSINGKRGRPLGRAGEVRNVRITPGNLPTFQE